MVETIFTQKLLVNFTITASIHIKLNVKFCYRKAEIVFSCKTYTSIILVLFTSAKKKFEQCTRNVSVFIFIYLFIFYCYCFPYSKSGGNGLLVNFE